MKPEILHLAAQMSRRGECFVIAQVVRRERPSSARMGDVALVTRDGRFHGWLGGSCTRPTVVREAQLALADGRARLISLSPDPAEPRPGVTVYPMTCHSGGRVDIYLEPVLPAPRLVVFGDSPVARALARLGKAVGYAVDVVAEAADAGLAPEADRVLERPVPPQGQELVFAVVATFGESDEAALRAALRLTPSYVGVIASRVRFQQLRETLRAGGVPAEELERIKAPAGIDIGAEGPEEIALSVLAEIVRERRRLAHDAVSAPPTQAEAVDPVCGMTVSTAAAEHVAEVAGRSYYFCCGGCRERFLIEPERYAVGNLAGDEA